MNFIEVDGIILNAKEISKVCNIKKEYTNNNLEGFFYFEIYFNIDKSKYLTIIKKFDTIIPNNALDELKKIRDEFCNKLLQLK